MISETTKEKMTAPETYWNRAGELGYDSAMYASTKVATRVNTSMWGLLLEAASDLGLNKESSIIELGCGDGNFALNVLSPNFRSIDAYDLAPAAIDRANSMKQPNSKFYCTDITTLDYQPDQKWDGCFLVGILHHVKKATPDIISRLAKVTNRIIVMEPNGNNLGRKFLELLPSYKNAGEDSFKRKDLEEIFNTYGFKRKFFKRFNLFPNFTPDGLYPLVSKIEPLVENSQLFNRLCTAQVFGFEKVS